jgi:hypothetical protein
MYKKTWFIIVLLFCLANAAIGVPATEAVSTTYDCASINGQSGGSAMVVSSNRYLDIKAGETLTVDVHFLGATKVTLEVPSGTVVGTLTGDGRLSHTFSTTGMVYVTVNSSYDGVHGFSYTYSCGMMAAGPDMVSMPANAVVGTFNAATPLMAHIGDTPNAAYMMQPGQSLWVFGVDASGAYYQVLLSGQLYWVPVSSMGPTYDAVWNGAPLPASVVE